MMAENFNNFFSNMFSIIILENKIVATVLNVLQQQFSRFNNRINKQLNDDI